MRPARVRTTTLADVQTGTRAEICTVCRHELRAGEPLAWGLAHERLHERCLDGLCTRHRVPWPGKVPPLRLPGCASGRPLPPSRRAARRAGIPPEEPP